MSVVSVVGMHRSGTSMVTRLLNLSGFYLGDEQDLLLPAPENPEGFWENQEFVSINDEILSKLGGGWDYPPQLTPKWELSPELVPALIKAKNLIGKFTSHDLWAWKDPRTSLTIPFWHHLLPELKVLICVRNPLEVAQSLYKRNYFSPAAAYNLWLTYNQRILSSTNPSNRIVTRYDLFFQDPEAELIRIMNMLNIAISEETIINLINAISLPLRHNQFSMQDLINSKPPAEILNLYENLCLESEVSNELPHLKITPNLTHTNDFAELLKKNEIAKLEVINYEQSQKIEMLSVQMSELDSNIEVLTSQLDDSKSDIQILTSQLDKYYIDTEQLKTEKNELQMSLASIYQSRSWQVTSLFRKIGSVIRIIKSKAELFISSLRFKYTRNEVWLLESNLTNKELEKFHQFIDRIMIRDQKITLDGWAFHEDWVFTSVDLMFNYSKSRHCELPINWGLERVDVHQQYKIEEALRSGFQITTNLPYRKQNISIHFHFLNDKYISLTYALPLRPAQEIKPNRVKIINYLLKLLTIERIIKLIKYFLRGDISFIKNRFMSLYIDMNTLPIKKDLMSLKYSVQLFHAQLPSEIIDTYPEVDIIVPVYNGIEYLPRLFESIVQNTNTPYRLIIVDDNSSDPNVRSFLRKFAQKESRVLLLFNNKNMGFVKSVNYAATHTKNHFVILNTDVEVPKGWLKRLMWSIWENPKVASTTPFTNAGTICSFPNFVEDNPLFCNLELDVIDSAFQHINIDAIPINMPTGVGFCMGINKSTWEEIGGFNELVFGHGYGEENDWCMRAIAAGYLNTMALNLFVYHKHGGSFLSDEKQKLMKENWDKLIKLHPNYPNLIETFIKSDPVEPIRNLIKMLLMANALHGKNLLIIDHELGGGANIYSRKIIEKQLLDGNTVFMLTFDQTWKSMKLTVNCKEHKSVFEVQHVEDVRLLVGLVQINHIYINNLVSFDAPLEIINLLGELKNIFDATLIVYIHDYYALCPSYTLLDYQGNYCNLPNTETCNICLPKNKYRYQNQFDNISQWRQDWSQVLLKADETVCFSESSRNLLQRVYPRISENIVVQPHSLSISFPKKPNIDITSPLCIGMIGSLNYAKGSQMVLDVAKLFSQEQPDLKMVLIGAIDRVPESSNLKIVGPYTHAELPDLLEKYNINMCFFSSICPETFSYVTSELIELEMPICGFDLGAPAERIGNYKLGHLISTVNAEAAHKEILIFYEKLKETYLREKLNC